MVKHAILVDGKLKLDTRRIEDSETCQTSGWTKKLDPRKIWRW